MYGFCDKPQRLETLPTVTDNEEIPAGLLLKLTLFRCLFISWKNCTDKLLSTNRAQRYFNVEQITFTTNNVWIKVYLTIFSIDYSCLAAYHMSLSKCSPRFGRHHWLILNVYKTKIQKSEELGFSILARVLGTRIIQKKSGSTTSFDSRGFFNVTIFCSFSLHWWDMGVHLSFFVCDNFRVFLSWNSQIYHKISFFSFIQAHFDF